MTVLLLAAQEQYLSGPDGNQNGRQQRRNGREIKDDFVGRGIQVVVGHYQGKIGDEPKKNISQGRWAEQRSSAYMTPLKPLSDVLDSNQFDPRPGFGENGRAVKLDAIDESRAKELFQINQFNLVASDRIALNRSLPDMRKKACRVKEYPRVLPTTSVIIVYHNEAWSTLLRTVTSVINRSPRHLLKEIVLVDDYSNRGRLWEGSSGL